MSAEQSDLFGQRIGYMPTAPRVSIEHWIARRLGRPDLLAGVTTPEERRERIRAAILTGQHAEAIAGKREGAACLTWREVWAELYGTPLTGPG